MLLIRMLQLNIKGVVNRTFRKLSQQTYRIIKFENISLTIKIPQISSRKK